MRTFTRFYHGKRIQGVFCSFCDMKRDGVVMREDFYWKKLLDCGHKVGRSFVLPPSEMRRLGYVDRDIGRDPRSVAQSNSIIADAKKVWEERKRKRWIGENLAGGRRYM